MKKPIIFFHDAIALQGLRDGESGAELHVLEGLAHLVLSGKEISPAFQLVVNAIVAKAVLSGKLPTNSKGRPANFMHGADGWSIANRFLELTDNGKKYAEAIEQVADEFPQNTGKRMSDRRIEQLVKENKPGIERRVGKTQEERKIFRDRVKMSASTELSAEDAECVTRIVKMVDAAGVALTAHLENETRRDYLADLDNLIAQSLTQFNPDEIK